MTAADSPSSERSGGPNRLAGRGTLHLMLGRALLFVCGYLVSVLLARELGPVEYGTYGLILSVLLWLEHIGDCGIPEALSKLIAEDNERALRRQNTGQTLLLIVSLLLFVLAWLVAPLFASVFQIPAGATLFRLAIIDIPFTGVYFAYQGILGGRRHFGVIGSGLAVYGLTKLIGTLIAMLLGLSISLALVVNILATVGAAAFLATHVSPATFRLSVDEARTILRFALPVALYLLALQILPNLDLWLLKIVVPEQPALFGLYVAALNIARIPALLFSSVNAVILPSLSVALARRDADTTRRYVQGAGRFLWVTLLPSCLLLALTADELMPFVFSDRYSGGAPFLAVQVFAFALFATAQVFSDMLIAHSTPRLAARAAAFHIPVSLLFNLVLIPRFGALGAATALLLTGALLALVTGFTVVRHYGSLIQRSTLVNGMLATTLMAVTVLSIPPSGPWLLVKYSFVVGLYGLALILLRELRYDDLKLLAPR